MTTAQLLIDELRVRRQTIAFCESLTAGLAAATLAFFDELDLMREAANRLGEAMAGTDWREPALPVVQNVDGEVHEGIQSIRDALVRQLYLPVRWTSCMQALGGRGVTRFAECGPGKVLTGLAKRIDKAFEARIIETFGLQPAKAQGGT